MRGVLLLGSASAVSLLEACGSSSSSPSPQQSTGPVSLSFEGWNYDPAFTSARVSALEQQSPNMHVSFVAEPADQYEQKMIARFTSGDAPDALFVKDDLLASWADAGYLRPVQGLSGWDTYASGLIPFDRAGMTYKGKLWGLPYFGDHIAYLYNKQMLAQAHIDTPPTTWDDVGRQATELKRSGILDAPIVFPVKAGAGLHWWAAIYGSGGNLFDRDSNPLFPDKDQVALHLLEWLVDAAQNKKILNLKSVQMGTAETRLAIAAGQVAFASSARYDLKLINDPRQSKIAGAGTQVLFPSLTSSGPHGTVGFTHMYCISSKTSHVDAAWKLVQWVGSVETAKAYYLKNGVGYAYETLNKDPQVVAETSRWSDQAMFVKQAGLARARQALSAPWFYDWDRFNLQQLQEALLGQKSPRQALTDSANKARALKKST